MEGILTHRQHNPQLQLPATVLTALATITTAATFATSIFFGVVFVVVVAIVSGNR